MAESSIRNLRPSDPRYDPLPFETDPVSRSSTPASPQAGNASFPMEELPSGAARPRFQGHALRDDGSFRDSFASSTYNAQSVNSSVYALNPAGAGAGASSDFLAGYRDDPNAEPQDNHVAQEVGVDYLEEKRQTYGSPRTKQKKRWGVILGIIALVVVVAAAILIPLYFFVFKSKDKSSSGDTSSSDPASPSSSGGSNGGVRTVVTGGDGSTITKDDGTTFTYKNSFGGTWYWDPEDPFNNGARAQSWTPALNETFKYGIDIIRGVNIGGWLNTEPFISPALYEKYLNASTPAVDEWTLSENMRSDTAGGGISQLEDHYKTFITEEDFAQIAGAGLNFVRIPLPYWAIETRENEPFLANTSWTYFLKAIQWARKYGLRINLDLHALPGSQNGWNHSGRLGSVNVLNGPMGYANAQRSLDYIRILAEFISQEQFKDVVVMFGITNEPQAPTFGQDALSRYYLQAYGLVRTAGGIGQGNGPFISYHDGFIGQNNWAGFLPGADRIALDTHPYLCFGSQSSSPLSSFVDTPCDAWAAGMNKSMSAFGLSAAGEFSLAVNDCGLYVNGVNLGTRYEGDYTPGSWPRIGSCDPWLDWENWDAATKANYKQLALSSMDALQNWFFWTWKIGNSTATGKVMAPHWSYQLGLENGWMPTDPREAIGSCGGGSPFEGPLAPSQTGGAGADSIPAAVSSSLAWPPATLSNAGAVTLLPSYTPTGPVPTLPGPTFTATSGKATSTISGGNGWANSADKAGLMTDIAGCSYLDPWVGNADPPSPLCSAAAKREAVPEPMLTGAPMWR